MVESRGTMTDDQGREVFVSLVLVSAIPVQAVCLYTEPRNDWLGWAVFAALLACGWAHVDGLRSGRNRK